MATLGQYALTLADWAKQIDPDGSVAAVAELLDQKNGILTDMLWKEGNLETGHRITVRTSLPTPTWRLLNQGVQPTKATTAQVDEACAMLESWSEIDVKLAALNGNTSAFRVAQAQPHIEAMRQEFAGTLCYGNGTTSPEEFTGLATRYNSLSGTNAQNIVVGGGSGSDNSSVYLVCWGQNSVYGIFPKGSQIGLKHEDLGKQVVEVTAGVEGTRMLAYRDHFTWDCGIAVEDWRYVVRIPNVDISALIAKSSAADLPELMIKAIHRIPDMEGKKPVFYMNRTCMEMFDIQKRDDIISGGGLTWATVDGVYRPTFRGIPVVIVDQLTEAEATVS